VSPGAIVTSSSDPYSLLDPGGDGQRQPAPLVDEAGTVTVLLRGLRKRCPRCGQRRIFDGWFSMKALCPRCRLRFEQEQGGFLGAMTLNYAVAFGAWIAMLVVALILTVPDVPVAPLLAASVVILVGVPLWFYPRSKSLWAAIEFLVLRSEPGYRGPVVRDPRADGLE
jgi:uncharacterized protein (DUF983 family)